MNETCSTSAPTEQEQIGTLTIIWDKEKRELLDRIAQLERDMQSVVDHLWKGNAVEHQSRLSILEAAVQFWSNESMSSHLDKINQLSKRIQAIEALYQTK